MRIAHSCSLRIAAVRVRVASISSVATMAQHQMPERTSPVCVESETAVNAIIIQPPPESPPVASSPSSTPPPPPPLPPPAMGEGRADGVVEQGTSPGQQRQSSSTSTSVIRQLTSTGTIITTVGGRVEASVSPQEEVLLPQQQQQLSCPGSETYPPSDYFIPNEMGYEGNFTVLNPQYLDAYAASSQAAHFEPPFHRDEAQSNGLEVEYMPQPHHTVTLHNEANMSATYSYADPSYQLSSTTTAAHDMYTGSTSVVMLDENVPAPYSYGQCVICGQPVHPQQQNFTDTRGHTICNNCAMRANTATPRTLRPNGVNRSAKRPAKTATQTRRTGVTCANCQTNKTTLWRRNNGGEPVCNSCGLYYKLHNMNRPKSMVKDTIQTRKRKPKPTATMVSHPSHPVRMPSLHPSTLHHHPAHPLAHSSDISMMASYPTDQPYTLPAYINPQMRANNGGGDEQATVITSTSTNSANHHHHPSADDYAAADEMRDL